MSTRDRHRRDSGVLVRDDDSQDASREVPEYADRNEEHPQQICHPLELQTHQVLMPRPVRLRAERI